MAFSKTSYLRSTSERPQDPPRVATKSWTPLSSLLFSLSAGSLDTFLKEVPSQSKAARGASSEMLSFGHMAARNCNLFEYSVTSVVPGINLWNCIPGQLVAGLRGSRACCSLSRHNSKGFPVLAFPPLSAKLQLLRYQCETGKSHPGSCGPATNQRSLEGKDGASPIDGFQKMIVRNQIKESPTPSENAQSARHSFSVLSTEGPCAARQLP